MVVWFVIGTIIFGLVVGISVYLISKKIFHSNAEVIIEQAKAKAKAIECEAQNLLKNQQMQLEKDRMLLQQQLDKEQRKLHKEYEMRTSSFEKDIQHQQHQLQIQKQQVTKELQEASQIKNSIMQSQEQQEKYRQAYESARGEMLEVLSNYTKLTMQEAKQILLTHLEDELSEQKANLIRRYEKEASEEAKKKANYILAQATTRYAGEFATERLINIVNLPNDELKGRIIGKEGRNIKALEMVCGVDVIIDDTPCSIILSSFNLYRRAIATKTIENLVEDGRIQPARIEEVYEKVKAEMDEQMRQDGKNIVLDLGLGYMHPELEFLLGKMRYRASFGQNALGHSIEVANLAAIIAGELGGDEKLARRAGILHDIGKALTQEIGGNHIDLGVDICTRYKEHPVVLNAIKAHHGHEEIKSVECAAVCAADTLSAARPGARREVLENFLKRVQDIEHIAMEKMGVKQAYAINAGREVRVIVRADLVSDAQSIVLAREIAREIEDNLQYPGEVKVSVIREIRAVEFAK